ncbi:PAS domain-containing protein [Phenylobacterium sp. 20VBR1]|uniref:histidine kinase n=1 Tax=Phenylobacterium glaciei TaxID=2803784 RepID=A0A941D398_9CAUL|nr:PAS domain-containing protein [Phenylobacterium glaciei]
MTEAESKDARVRSLMATGILDTEAETAFDDVVRLAALVCKTPIAVVSFVDAERQWFKAKVGLEVSETPVEMAICRHVLVCEDIEVFPDLTKDTRTVGNVLVTETPSLRFYAGARVDSPDGVPIGSVAVIDTVPRPEGLTAEQTETLLALARQVMAQLAMRAQAVKLKDGEDRFRAIADSMPQMVWSTLPDGYHDYYNARWYEFTGMEPGATDGEAWNDMFHPDDRERAWALWSHSLETGVPYEIEYRLRRHDGAYRWTLGRALPIRDEAGYITRWFGTCTDIDDAKRLAEERELVSQELSHRIKNIFAVISGLISLSARTHPESKAYAMALRDRVMALGRAHDFVRPHSKVSQPNARAATAFALLSELFSPYDGAGGLRISLEGDDIGIDDRAATPLALIFHELATNAAKYGALSAAGGHVSITANRMGDDYRLIWRETGGPAVAGPPAVEGFGSTLSKVSVEGQLGGTLVREWLPQGLQVTMVAPAKSYTRPSRVN